MPTPCLRFICGAPNVVLCSLLLNTCSLHSIILLVFPSDNVCSMFLIFFLFCLVSRLFLRGPNDVCRASRVSRCSHVSSHTFSFVVCDSIAGLPFGVCRDLLATRQVWTTMPEGTYGAGERIDIYVGFRFLVILESSTAFLSVNTQAGGKHYSSTGH